MNYQVRRCGLESEDDDNPNQEVIDMLGYLLHKAEMGEIHGLGIVSVRLSRQARTISVGSAYSGPGVIDNVYEAVGAIEVLKHRLLHDKFPWSRDVLEE